MVFFAHNISLDRSHYSKTMSTLSMNCSQKLYRNNANIGNYYYPREYQTDDISATREMTLDGNDYINVRITGIPDGVSPLANEAIVSTDCIYRLYIFAEQPLNETVLQALDKFYGKKAYPIIMTDTVCGVIDSIPKNNFYMCKGTPSNISEYTEYRYLQQRHMLTNIVFDSETNSVYRLVLPERPQLVLIMPNNFVRTGLKKGYFRFDNNLIVRIYSKYILSSALTEDSDVYEMTVFDIADTKLRSTIEGFFGRLGLHKIATNVNDQLYAYDKYITAIVGNASNLIVP